MGLKKEQEILGAVAASVIQEKKGLCPTDEEFALYIEGNIDEERRKAVVLHFVSCRECRERLTIPIHHSEIPKVANPMEKLRTPLRYPFVAAPVALIFVALIAFSLNVYLSPRHITEGRLRGGNLVAIKQLDLTPNLLTIIKKENEEGLKNEIIKDLPSGAKVSDIVVEDIKNLKAAKEGDRIVLILYSNGLLKVRLEK